MYTHRDWYSASNMSSATTKSTLTVIARLNHTLREAAMDLC